LFKEIFSRIFLPLKKNSGMVPAFAGIPEYYRLGLNPDSSNKPLA